MLIEAILKTWFVIPGNRRMKLFSCGDFRDPV
jgi:hypothetical protein